MGHCLSPTIYSRLKVFIDFLCPFSFVKMQRSFYSHIHHFLNTHIVKIKMTKLPSNSKKKPQNPYSIPHFRTTLHPADSPPLSPSLSHNSSSSSPSQLRASLSFPHKTSSSPSHVKPLEVATLWRSIVPQTPIADKP